DSQDAVTIDHDEGTTRLIPLSRAAGETVVLEVETPDVEFGEVLSPKLALIVVGGLAAAVVAVLIVRLRTRSLVDTMDELIESARAPDVERPMPPVPERTPVELVRLRGALVNTADRWQQLRTDERKLVADLSHRLRTPLTALRLNAADITNEKCAE